MRPSSYCLVYYTIPMPVLVVHGQGMSRFIRCGLVIIVYLIATSPLAVRSIFVQVIGDDETQGTTYIYSRGWILLCSTSFMANILITNCIAVRPYHYTYLSEGVDAGYGLDLALLVSQWSQMDVCCHSRAVHHHRNQFVPFIVVAKWV